MFGCMGAAEESEIPTLFRAKIPKNPTLCRTKKLDLSLRSTLSMRAFMIRKKNVYR